MKHCNKCDTTKEDAEFHIRKASRDGLAAMCKSCQSLYDRKRANLPKRVKAREEYAKTEKGKEAFRRAREKYKQRYPERRNAHVMVGNAVRDKRLIKESCFMCGDENTVGHHVDYSKPLEVIWLCQCCHKKIHAYEDLANEIRSS